MGPKTVLAGDVGGTKTQLALLEWDAGQKGSVVRERYEPPPLAAFEVHASREAPGLAVLARGFVERHGGRPDVACFGIAGPVTNGHVKAPNIPWEVDAGELREALGLRTVVLLNDLEACAYGILCLDNSQVKTLQTGNRRPGGVVSVLAAGTGLGEAALVHAGGCTTALASESGHADFAPFDAESLAYWHFVKESEPRVSCEKALAGPALARMYAFVKSRGEGGIGSKILDTPDAIGARALAGSDPAAVQALRLFTRIYGSEAGNVALRRLPYGGLYLAGGIAPKILPFLERGEFLAAFRAKGRMERLMGEFPVHVVLEPKAPLLGAALLGAVQ